MAWLSPNPACMHTLPRVHGEEGERLPLGFAQELNPRLLCRHTLPRVAMTPLGGYATARWHGGRQRGAAIQSGREVGTTCGSRW